MKKFALCWTVAVLCAQQVVYAETEPSRAQFQCEDLYEAKNVETGQRTLDCFQRLIDRTENALRHRDVPSRATGEVQEVPAARSSSDDAIELAAVLARRQMFEERFKRDENRHNFKDPSVALGMAVLREPSLDGSNELVEIAEAHTLLHTWRDDTVGVGPFIALSLTEGISDYIGIGVVFGFRFKDTPQPFNFGVGYMIDKEGFPDEAMQRQGDRSGLFFMASLNGGYSLDALLKRLALKK